MHIAVLKRNVDYFEQIVHKDCVCRIQWILVVRVKTAANGINLQAGRAKEAEKQRQEEKDFKN